MSTPEQEIYSADARQQAFKELFGSLPGFLLAKERGIRGELRDCPIRSICWRVFLEVLPSNERYLVEDNLFYDDEQVKDPSPNPAASWVDVIRASRKSYEDLKNRLLVDPYKAQVEDLTLANPLSQEEASPWRRFFDNVALQKEINQDIERTYPEKKFFQRKSTQDTMLTILFIYAKEHPAVEYKQGMHELLAPIIYLLDREKVPANEVNESDVPSILNDERYLEHDAFTMFSKLMEVTEPWFVYNNNMTEADFADTSDEAITSPVVIKCKKIQHILLKQKDPQLFTYLEALKIEPQLYALRWIRLLFGREFHLEDVLVIWDALFAYGKRLALVDYVSLAMLTYIRSQLLEMDYNYCLRRLFKYPPVEDVSLFIEKALGYARPASGTTPIIVSPSRVAESEAALPEEYSLLSTTKPVVDEPLERSVQELVVEVRKLQDTQLHMANRIERIVYILQNSLRETNIDSTAMEPVLMAVAELKQVKDILGGNLPAE